MKPCQSVGLVVLLVLAGCEKSPPASIEPANPVADQLSHDPDLTLEHDAGVVVGDVEHQFSIPWTQTRTVKSISKGCGCTAANVAEGQTLAAGQYLKMHVATKGKSSGAGGQSLLLTFDDGGTCKFLLKYEYLQPPYVSPKYLVFRPMQPHREVELVFPGVTQPELLEIKNADDSLTVSVERLDPKSPDKLVAKLSYDYSRATDAQERFLVFKCRAASQEHELRFGYLALRHD